MKIFSNPLFLTFAVSTSAIIVGGIGYSLFGPKIEGQLKKLPGIN